MKNYINKIVVIFSVAMLVVSMCACGKSEVSDTTATTTVEKVSTDADATKEEATKADLSSETQTTTELAKITTEKTTDSVTEEENAVTEKSTTESKKSESATEKRVETTQQTTTQNQSTTQATTQHSKPGNSGNNGNSQNNNQTATTSHSHTWVNHTKTVHHDAQYEDQEVTKYKKEEHLFCNTCGADITNIGSDAHYAASGTMWVNGGTDENPWWVEVTRCAGCHTGSVNVPYTETEKVKVQDAYDEEIVDYQYCSGCGQRK
jgi:hypothetical protein